MDIKNLIRLKRKSKQLKQYELAEMLNISKKEIYHIERNVKDLYKFDIFILEKLCEILDIDFNLMLAECEKNRS
ncbi:helix-turn-helix domain-containing protein [Paraclostridium sordellii]|uniref:helix-turn-helix domain-containing protein n=1 Tax=Paraclostridium sordellii TaxID=1505 RepID=UPI0002FECEBF|nr:helix-turn-helix transcriptional regulator [Paeniclostridium sordellii]